MESVELLGIGPDAGAEDEAPAARLVERRDLLREIHRSRIGTTRTAVPSRMVLVCAATYASVTSGS